MTPLSKSINSLLSDFYRCPKLEVDFLLKSDLRSDVGYFSVNDDLICFGHLSDSEPAATVDLQLPKASFQVNAAKRSISASFDPVEVVENLRTERYMSCRKSDSMGHGSLVRALYYSLRPLLPVKVRKHLQRLSLRGWDQIPFPHWPVDRTVDSLHGELLVLAMNAAGVTEIPFVWFWPDGYSSCAAITHDVETSEGRDFCSQLMDINDTYGIKSSFQVVPEERYEVPAAFLDSIRDRGFEVNVHDLNHDGHLFSTQEQFLARVKEINRYGREYRARGFRSAVLYRNFDWMKELDFDYDMSAPNVAHLDPQRGGCCTLMPYFVGDLLEIPVTVTQDYSLFHILREYSMSLWSKQVTAITEAHGMATFIIHPDYVIERQARETYKQLLAYLADMRAADKLWIAKPGDINDWWRSRAKMQLLHDANGWRIEGKNSERARIAYARVEGGRLAYDIN